MADCKTCNGQGTFRMRDRLEHCMDCGGKGQREPGAPPAYCRDPEHCTGTCRREIACNE